MRRYLNYFFVICIVAGSCAGINLLYRQNLEKHISQYMAALYRAERTFIEKIPIYGDFAEPALERELRTFLLEDHLKAARKWNFTPVSDINELVSLQQEGKLVALREDQGRRYYFYNVRKELRCLVPGAEKVLEELTGRFQDNLQKRGCISGVKIALSSVFRTRTYQKRLRHRNINASLVTTHSYGISFDIFYDDYFVDFPKGESGFWVPDSVINEIHNRYGYLAGDALRRQFRSVLMETLLEMQREGKIYAIYEQGQRCYHVTVLKK